MKHDTEYGIICEKKDEKTIISGLNSFLSQYNRTFSKTKSAGLLAARLPYKYKYFYFNLNKDMGTYMELFPNEDAEGLLKYSAHKDTAWILKVLIHDNTFPGYEKVKTEKYINDMLAATDFKINILLETDDKSA